MSQPDFTDAINDEASNDGSVALKASQSKHFSTLMAADGSFATFSPKWQKQLSVKDFSLLENLVLDLWMRDGRAVKAAYPIACSKVHKLFILSLPTLRELPRTMGLSLTQPQVASVLLGVS